MSAVASRDPADARALSAELGGAARATTAAELPQHAELLFLTVPDAALGRVCEQLAVGPVHALVHTSGALPASALEAARARGARIAAFHPLQSFPPGADAARFRGVYVGVEADAELEPRLFELARALGACPFSLAGVDRARYHAAAVFASNYVVALHAAARAAWVGAGLPPEQASRALLPLTAGVVHSLDASALEDALTGPLARGDVETLALHLRSLEFDEELVQAYAALGRQLLRLSLPLPPALREQLLRLLAAAPAPPPES